jgi:hypothetical protein
MEPHLSVKYASNVGDVGLMGVAFALTGISVMTRCAKTVAQDGRAASAQFKDDGPDAGSYCLDGLRLVEVAPTSDNGASGILPRSDSRQSPRYEEGADCLKSQ